MIWRIGLYVLLVLGSPALILAQSDDFTIRIFGAVDIVAPTVPVITSVTPVTVSQIDVVWGPSTDNFTVFGYVVLRDGVPIATTTITSFSDSGLAASTTYSYQVVAFDSVPNYSSSSVAIATTTLAIPPAVVPPTIPDQPPQVSTIARVALESSSVVVGVSAATLQVQVRMPARIEVRLGRTRSYETGYFVGSIYRREHLVPINDLQSNTTYYYEVIGYTPSGAQTVLRQGSFTTDNDAPPPSPANVVNFAVVVAGEAVTASWQRPDGFPTDGLVRVVRSHLGFPATINDGLVVYEGRGDTLRDTEAFALSDIAYYTAFVIDPNGLVSSGAIAVARQTNNTNLPGDLGGSALGNDGVGVPTQAQPLYDQLPPDPNMPLPAEILVSQGGVTYSFASSSITLASDELFTVAIEAGAIAGAFKTIVVTLDDPRGSGKTFSFLLRLNNDRTQYTATIAPVWAAGTATLLVDVYDYDAKVVGSYATQLVFEVARGTSSSTFELVWFRLQAAMWGLLLVVPLLTLGGLWLLFRRRRQEDEDNETSV